MHRWLEPYLEIALSRSLSLVWIEGFSLVWIEGLQDSVQASSIFCVQGPECFRPEVRFAQDDVSPNVSAECTPPAKKRMRVDQGLP